MAAGQAALCGAQVRLLEKMEQPGKKIRISGKGRCNLTNQSELHEFISNFNKNGRFLHQAFNRFFIKELLHFFAQQNLQLTTERGGRVFPQHGNAGAVMHALSNWLKQCGVTVECNSPVQELLVENNCIVGITTQQGALNCDGVILATGGATYPATGSSGDGYALAEAVGHSIVTLRPALVPLLIQDSFLHQLGGLDLRNVGFRLYVQNKRKKSDFGELSFNRSGIGGPVVLTHSLYAVDRLAEGKQVEIGLDLKPALDDNKLDSRLVRDFSKRKHEQLRSVLRGILPMQLIPVCLKYSSLDGNKPAGEITAKERTRLRIWLKDFRFTISGHRPLKDGMVTAGGVKVNEVNPHTMESKLVKNLYLVGELLDIDANTGGYNLQAAFSTGYVAGQAAGCDDKS